MFSTILFATSFAAWETREDGSKFFDLGSDISFELETPVALAEESDLRATLAKRKFDPKHIVTQDQMNKGLHKTDCSDYIQKKAHFHAPGSEKCWNYWWSTPGGCPGSGWVKYSDFHVVGAKVGKAGVSVDEHNHVGLTVSDVSFNIARTPFTVQEKGLLTFPCSGVLEGVISGAVNAVEAVIKLSAEGVPIIGEAAASPVDGAIVKIKHVLDGLCGALEDIIEDVLGLIKGLLGGVVGKLLPEVIEGLLKLITGTALDVLEAGPSADFPGQTQVSTLELREGWTRIM